VPRHPNKEINAALRYADSRGWTIVESVRGHCWGMIRCPHGRGGCQKSVWSTPQSPEDHAKSLRRFVDNCPHQDEEETGNEEA
jgi:hypothetical protein